MKKYSFLDNKSLEKFAKNEASKTAKHLSTKDYFDVKWGRIENMNIEDFIDCMKSMYIRGANDRSISLQNHGKLK